MKNKLIYTVLFLFVIVLSNKIFAQSSSLWRPFSDCYIPDIQNHSDCSEETIGWKSFNITTQSVSCNIGVGYRIKRCNLPTPTIFIDLNYISVSIQNCPELICKLHPGCSVNSNEGESCFQVGDTINVLGINYTVISVSVPYCEPGCNSNDYLE